MACDHRHIILDVCAKWPGAAHDSRIFENSGLREMFERGKFHEVYRGVLSHGRPSDLFVDVRFKFQEWGETGLHVGSACYFGSSISSLVNRDADVARKPPEINVEV